MKDSKEDRTSKVNIMTKSLDEIYKMSDEEKLSYLKEEVEKVITSAPPKNQLKLRKIQARLDGIRRKVKNPIASYVKIKHELLDHILYTGGE